MNLRCAVWVTFFSGVRILFISIHSLNLDQCCFDNLVYGLYSQEIMWHGITQFYTFFYHPSLHFFLLFSSCSFSSSFSPPTSLLLLSPPLLHVFFQFNFPLPPLLTPLINHLHLLRPLHKPPFPLHSFSSSIPSSSSSFDYSVEKREIEERGLFRFEFRVLPKTWPLYLDLFRCDNFWMFSLSLH